MSELEYQIDVLIHKSEGGKLHLENSFFEIQSKKNISSN